MSLRVVCVGTGLVGQQGIMAVLDHPEMELVGVVVHSDDKAGRDAGELVGRAPVGVKAIQSFAEALALQPDVVAYFNTSHGRLKATIEEFRAALAAGSNVVTTSVGALINPKTARPDVLAQLNAACEEGGGTTLFSTGIDPGVFSDFMPVVLSGCGRRIDGIRIFEMATYESGQQSDSVSFEICGFGEPTHTVTPLVDPAGLSATWGGTIHMIAEQLDVQLDEIVSSHEMLPSPETFAYQGRVIEQGTIAGMRFEIAGIKDGKKLISVAHVTRARHDLAPDWPRPLRGDAYRVVIEGEPRLDCEFEFSSETGEHLTGGWAITAMRAINAIPLVVAAGPGVKSVFDLPVITGRGRLG
ncbi:MAG: diacylglycerol kinase [Actinomycetota bacterium]|nr:diacylglycerol kinase [Actinomycetota bacterium]